MATVCVALHRALVCGRLCGGGTRTFSDAAARSYGLDLGQRILRGDRRALSKGITLVESTRRDHQQESEALLMHVLTAGAPRVPSPPLASASRFPPLPSIRIGISGPPGTGKSTFIEAFGMHLLQQGHRVAVLAVDPSSCLTGGSILGDKTRSTPRPVCWCCVASERRM
jgi:LAO/AO transport system kinase